MRIELWFGIGGLKKEGAKSKVGEAWCGVILTTIVEVGGGVPCATQTALRNFFLFFTER